MNNIKSFLKKYELLIILSIILVLIFIIYIIGKSTADPNSGYLKNQTVDNLSFENAEIIYGDGISTFQVEVYNESDDIYSLKNISIKFTDKDNNETILIGYIGESLEKDEAKQIEASIDKDLNDSVSLEYIINK